MLMLFHPFHLWLHQYLALGLILLGLIFIIAEVLITSFGILGSIGAIALAVGAILLIKGPTGENPVPGYLIILFSIIILVLILMTLHFILRSRRKPIVSGREALIGARARITRVGQQYWISLYGERWQCQSQYPLQEGEEVVVESVSGLMCVVKPIKQVERKT